MSQANEAETRSRSQASSFSAVSRITLPNGLRVWSVNAYPAAREVLGSPQRFGNDGRGIPDPSNEGVTTRLGGKAGPCGDLTVLDGTDHVRMRRAVLPFFSPGRLATLRPYVRNVVDQQIAHMLRIGPPVEFVDAFGLAVPSLVICELLGVPYDRRDEFQRRSRNRFDLRLSLDLRTQAAIESLAFMRTLVGHARRGQPPTERAGLIAELVASVDTSVTDDELAGLADILFLGGYETTAHMLSLGTQLLTADPKMWLELGSEKDPSPVVEELLRFLTVVKTGIPRVALVDTTLHGREIRAGERLLCALPTANKDPAFGSDAAMFRPGREGVSHLAFGHGVHRCLGASLARIELAEGFTALARSFPTLRVCEGPDATKPRIDSAVNGLDCLRVEW